MRSTSILVFPIIFIYLMISLFNGETAANDQYFIHQLENAVLQADWKTVIEQTQDNETLADSPVFRAIRGHACLALNQNNEALILFLSIDNDPSRQLWKSWTANFADRHSDNPVAYYLKGDGSARFSDYESAIQSYDKALEINPGFTLALIARGVAHAVGSRWDDSLKDLEKACKSKNPLAEAYACLGNLMLSKKSALGALEAYQRALKLSQNYALALNGIGCAKYGLGKWEEANEDFLAASKQFPLPLFLGNLRALGVASENLLYVGQENSPLFRFTDFLDWPSLQEESFQDNSLVRALIGHELPEKIDMDIVIRLNEALADPAFYSRIKTKIALEEASQQLMKLIEETEELRDKAISEIAKQHKEKIILLNRLLLEQHYPFYIAKHYQRDPGMQILFAHGLMDQHSYKKSLTPAQIAGGQWRMDHIYRPGADFLETLKLPVVSFLGKQFNRHFEFSTETNRHALKSQYGIDLEAVRPGGVTTDMRRAFVDNGNWPVANWFGLVQSGTQVVVTTQND